MHASMYRCMFCLTATCMRLGQCLRVVRSSEGTKVNMEKKLRQQFDSNQGVALQDVTLDEDEERTIIQTIVSAENPNMWAILMPAVYMLVPGSMIAKLWCAFRHLLLSLLFPACLCRIFTILFLVLGKSDVNVCHKITVISSTTRFNSIFPPHATPKTINGTKVFMIDTVQENVFANLMVISTSLALGLILGFVLVRLLHWASCCCCEARKKRARKAAAARKRDEEMHDDGDADDDEEKDMTGTMEMNRLATTRALFDGMFTADLDDPSDEELEEPAASRRRKADAKV